MIDTHELLQRIDLRVLAEEAGFSRTTVYRARTELGEQIVNTKNARDPHNEWILADDAETAADFDSDEADD